MNFGESLTNTEFVRQVVQESVIPLGMRARVRHRAAGCRDTWTVFWPLRQGSDIPVWELRATPASVDCLCRTAAGVAHWRMSVISAQGAQGLCAVVTLRYQLWGGFCTWLATTVPNSGHQASTLRNGTATTAPPAGRQASQVMQTIAQWDMMDVERLEQQLTETVTRYLLAACPACYLVWRGPGHWRIVSEIDGRRHPVIVAALVLEGYTARWKWARPHSSTVLWQWDGVRWASEQAPEPVPLSPRATARRRRWMVSGVAAAGGVLGGLLAGAVSLLAGRESSFFPTFALTAGWLWTCAWAVIWGSGDYPFS